MKLEPLLDNLKDIRTATGRYSVQLEIPKTSTLSESDIEKVLALSTWSSNPNKEAKGYEGIRSIIIGREYPITKRGIELAALQVSGIGYKHFDVSRAMPIIAGEEFCPPCKDNFMSLLNGTLMATSCAEDSEIITAKPQYRALGTYLHSELETKLKNTMEAANLELKNMVTPHVEAYGRYLDTELSNEEGGFGFMVFPVPGTEKLRAVNEIVEKFKGIIAGKLIPMDEAFLRFYYAMSPYTALLNKGLRELHDKGRAAHLQPHAANFYMIGGITYVMDWATLKKFGNNSEENILNRAIDVRKTINDYDKVLSAIFPNLPQEVRTGSGMLIQELALEAYSNNPRMEIDYRKLLNRAYEVLDETATEFDIIALWMKDEGIEGFPKHEANKKISRNAPCPCGSGMKYKRCCGSKS